MMLASINRSALLLALFAVIATSVIVVTALHTKPKIAANIRHAEARALLAIIPDDHHDNDMLEDFIIVADANLLGLRDPKKIYLAKRQDQVIAILVPVTARDGYTGDIDMVVGVNRDGSVAGVRVLSHRETPGLGDKIDYKKSPWVDEFIGKSLHNPKKELWKVKRDGGIFDQFTGATVTPRAVTKAVQQALEYVTENYAMIVSDADSQKP